MWILRFCFSLKALPQPGKGHLYGCVPLCMCIWAWRRILRVNVLLQPAIGQSKSEGPAAALDKPIEPLSLSSSSAWLMPVLFITCGYYYVTEGGMGASESRSSSFKVKAPKLLA